MSIFQDINFTNFGHKPDGFSAKDKLFSNSHLAGATLVEDVDLTKWFPPVFSQENIGSCVANSTVGAIMAQMAHKQNVDPSKIEMLSRLFVYWCARDLETPPDTDVDAGTRIRLAFNSLNILGVCSEKTYIYDVLNVNIRPTILAFREAVANTISAYYRIDATGDDRLVQVKQALSSGCPIVFGTALSDSYRNVNDDTVIQPPTDNFIGNHAQIIVAWSNSKQAFKIRNSWGANWGISGYCWMSPDYIKADITEDLWVATLA